MRRIFLIFGGLVMFLAPVDGASGACQYSNEGRSAKSLRVGLVQYRMSRPTNLKTWEARIERYLKLASRKKVELLVFPELIAIEGIALMKPPISDEKGIRFVADKYTSHFYRLFAEWSAKYGMTIVAGSWPVRDSSKGELFNEAPVFTPDKGLIHRQRKNHLTEWESKYYKMTGDNGGATTICLPGNVVAVIAICFDAEFPNYIALSLDPMPELIFVPSMTETAAGKFRVARTASARAVEHHAYVLVTGTVGGKSSDPILGKHVGQARFLTPSDKGFPDSGQLRLGAGNERVVIAELDLVKLRTSRVRSTTFPVKILREGASPP